MIRSVRHASDTHSPLAAVPSERAHDEVRILREIVTALCDRVELLEAHIRIARALPVPVQP